MIMQNVPLVLIIVLFSIQCQVMSLEKRHDNAFLTLLTITILLKLVTPSAYYYKKSCPFFVCTKVKHSLTLLFNDDSEPNLHYHKGQAEKVELSNLYRCLPFHFTLFGWWTFEEERIPFEASNWIRTFVQLPLCPSCTHLRIKDLLFFTFICQIKKEVHILFHLIIKGLESQSPSEDFLCL